MTNTTLITTQINLWSGDEFKSLETLQIPIDDKLLLESFDGESFLMEGYYSLVEFVKAYTHLHEFMITVDFPNITKETKKLRKRS